MLFHQSFCTNETVIFISHFLTVNTYLCFWISLVYELLASISNIFNLSQLCQWHIILYLCRSAQKTVSLFFQIFSQNNIFSINTFLLVDTVTELWGEKPNYIIFDNALTPLRSSINECHFLAIFDLRAVRTIFFSFLQKYSFENNILA